MNRESFLEKIQRHLPKLLRAGTRLTGMKVADSPAPIQLLGADTLQRTGSPDLMQSLAQQG